MEKTLILIRHAHRDTSYRELDNGLSDKGHKQAQALAHHFRATFGHRSAAVLSSPKRRCQETVEGIARAAQSPLKVSRLLDEQGPEETHRAFETRIRKFLLWWQNRGPALTVACSHGDWLPLAIERATGARADLSKAGWAEILLESPKAKGQPHARPVLRNLLQTVEKEK